MHRLDEVGADAELATESQLAALGAGTQHENRHMAIFANGAELLDEIEAVGVGHLQIGDDQGEGPLASGGKRERGHGGLSAVGRFRFKRPAGQHFRENDAIGAVVVDDENGEVLQERNIGIRSFGLVSRQGLDADSEMERAAVAGFALNPDIAAHEFVRRWEMAKPKPVPPNFRVVEPSA